MLFLSDRLWSLLLAALVLHGVVVQTQELGDAGGACAADAVSAQAECSKDGRPCEDAKGSLLQVDSQTHLQTSEAASMASRASVVETDPGQMQAHDPTTASKLGKEGQQLRQVSAMALLAVSEVVERSGIRKVTIFLFVLVVIFVVCPLLFLSRSIGHKRPEGQAELWKPPTRPGHESHGIGEEGRVDSVKGSGGFNSAGILPPTHSTLSTGASPASAGRLPSHQKQGLPMVASRHLCPGLVVPHGNECILAVPTLPASGSGELASLNVQDLDGKSVIQAEVALPESVRASDAQRPVVVLRASNAPRMSNQLPQPLLAYAKASYGVGSRRIVYVYDGCDALYAEVQKDITNDHRYILTSSRAGFQLFFEGDVLLHAMNVTNDQHQTVADTSSAVMAFNPTGKFYKLRVTSNVDVGLILIGLFSVDILEQSLS